MLQTGGRVPGVFAIQLARSRGAHVTTALSAHHFESVRRLGANQGIDYKAAPFEDEVGDIGRLLDAGELQPVADARAPFSQAPESCAGTVLRKGRGKVAVVTSGTP